MSIIKKQIIFFLLLGGFVPFAHSQETGQGKDQLAESAFMNVERMVKVILGNVYAEVGHIPHEQWVSMEPAATEYVKVLIEARKMENGEIATQRVAEAWEIFETAIDKMLTVEQKEARTIRRAGIDSWFQEMNAHFIQEKDLLLEKARTNGSATLKFEDDGVTRSVY